MKPSLLLLSAAVIIPAFVLIGLGTIAAFSAATISGVAAMLCQDYERPLSYRRLTVATARRAESLPMAA